MPRRSHFLTALNSALRRLIRFGVMWKPGHTEILWWNCRKASIIMTAEAPACACCNEVHSIRLPELISGGCGGHCMSDDMAGCCKLPSLVLAIDSLPSSGRMSLSAQYSHVLYRVSLGKCILTALLFDEDSVQKLTSCKDIHVLRVLHDRDRW